MRRVRRGDVVELQHPPARRRSPGERWRGAADPPRQTVAELLALEQQP